MHRQNYSEIYKHFPKRTPGAIKSKIYKIKSKSLSINKVSTNYNDFGRIPMQSEMLTSAETRQMEIP